MKRPLNSGVMKPSSGSAPLGHVLLDEVDQPARADDRQIRISARRDICGQLLQQHVPRHHLELDVDARIGSLEGLFDLLEIGAGLGAVLRDRHPDFAGIRLGRQRQHAQPGQKAGLPLRNRHFGVPFSAGGVPGSSSAFCAI